MIRAIYCCLVWMHPPSFRREFGGEMQWIFTEAVRAEGAGSLLFDALVSLMRQWLLRTGSWKYAVALLGAVFQTTLGGALMFRVGPAAHSGAPIAGNPEMAALVRLAAMTVIVLLAAVMLLVLWWRKLAVRTGA